MIVNLINHSTIPMPKAYLTACLKVVVSSLNRKGHRKDLKNRELVIVFVDRQRGKELNSQFRNKNYPTDVLSFNGDGELLGELVLCAPIVKAQSKEHKISYRDECIYLVIHGILHLLGYEHERGGAEADLMYKVQDDLFEKVLA